MDKRRTGKSFRRQALHGEANVSSPPTTQLCKSVRVQYLQIECILEVQVLRFPRELVVRDVNLSQLYVAGQLRYGIVSGVMVVEYNLFSRECLIIQWADPYGSLWRYLSTNSYQNARLVG